MCRNLFCSISLDKPHETHRFMNFPTQQGMDRQIDGLAERIPKGQLNTCKRNITNSGMRLTGVMMPEISRKELFHQISDLGNRLLQQDRFSGL